MLTIGVDYHFYSDVEKLNRMDDRPFFNVSMEALEPTDLKTLEKFAKVSFDVDKIVAEAGSLKIQSLLRNGVEKEFVEPSEEFVRLFVARHREGKLTPTVKDYHQRIMAGTIAAYVRGLVNERLSSALNASAPAAPLVEDAEPQEGGNRIVTTAEEIAGFHIVQAIASRLVAPGRAIMRDAVSYCAILLDDNNRKTIARIHFNGITKSISERSPVSRRRDTCLPNQPRSISSPQ